MRQPNMTSRTHIFCTAIAAAFAVSAAGCSDSDGTRVDQGTGGGSMGGVGLSSPEAARTQTGTALSLIASLDSVAAIGPQSGSGNAQQRRIGTINNGECDTGSVSDTSESAQDVDSPYTDQAFDLSGTSADACRLTGNLDGGESNDDFIEFDGSTEAGSVTESTASVGYAKVGDSIDVPYTYSYHIETDGENQGQSFSSETDLDFGIFLRVDSQDSSTDFEQQSVLDYSGDYSVSATSNGQTGSATGSFSAFVGTQDAPFFVSRGTMGTELAGSYGFALTPAPQGAQCMSGQATIATTDPLFVSTSSNGGSPYEAGTLEITSGGETASVTFNNDGTVTVTPAGGSADTVNYSEVVAAAAPCSGFVLGGLAFAATAR